MSPQHHHWHYKLGIFSFLSIISMVTILFAINVCHIQVWYCILYISKKFLCSFKLYWQCCSLRSSSRNWIHTVKILSENKNFCFPCFSLTFINTISELFILVNLNFMTLIWNEEDISPYRYIRVVEYILAYSRQLLWSLRYFLCFPGKANEKLGPTNQKKPPGFILRFALFILSVLPFFSLLHFLKFALLCFVN